MNQLQFSTKQLFTILAGTAVATVAVFSLGLLSATLIAERPAGVVEVPAQAPLAGLEQPAAPAVHSRDDSIIPIQAASAPAAESYGVQIALFAQRDNAVRFAARHDDIAFPARVFSRVEDDDRHVYPVLVGLYDSMAAAQQAKQAYRAQSATDSFVTDANGLREETLAAPTVAMLP